MFADPKLVTFRAVKYGKPEVVEGIDVNYRIPVPPPPGAAGPRGPLDHAVNTLITVIVLGFAFTGFFLLEGYQATLWLIFLIAAYPVAVSFSDPEVRRRLGEQSLVEMCKARLAQISVIGKLYSAWLKSKGPGDGPGGASGAGKPPGP